jgi:hypothetical protein
VSDRVAAITGNRKGIDHAWAFVSDKALLDPPVYRWNPVEIPLDTYMRWMWLVRQWQVDWPDFHTDPTFITRKDGLGNDIEDEHLIHQKTDIPLSFGPGIFADIFGSGVAILRRQQDQGVHLYNFATTKFLPPLEITLEFLHDSFSTDSGHHLASPGWTVESSGSSFIVDGFAIPMFWAHNTAHTMPTFTSFTVTPIEFYPFKNLAGQPVWDTATGLRTANDNT